MSKKNLLAFIPGTIGIIIEFFSREILLSGFDSNTLSYTTKSLHLITLLSFLFLYINSRKRNKS